MTEALGLIGLDSAFGWVQVRLRGGWFNLLATAAVYGMALGALMYFPARLLDPTATASYYGGWVHGLLGLQAAVLLMFAGSRVTAAVRLDFSTRMIESHRLMPVGAGSAVAGYLVGATSQGLCLAAVNFLLGLFASAGSGFPADRWLWVNGVLGLFAAFTWVVLAYFAFFARLAFALLLLPVGAFWLSQGAVLTAVPALAVLFSPMIGWSVFSLRGAGLDFAYGVAAVAQVGIGAIFFEAARRKYRRDDAVGLGPVLGLLLLAACVAVSWAGIWYWEEFGPRYLRRSWVSPDAQMISSLVCLTLLAMVPVAAAARIGRDRGALSGRSGPARREGGSAWRVPHLLVVLAAAAIVSGLVWVKRDPATLWRPMHGATADAAWQTTAVVLLCLVSFSYAARAAHRHARWPRLAAGAWVLATWLVPIMADLIRYSRTEQTSHDQPVPQPMTWLSTCSPLGALLFIWRGVDVRELDTTAGLWVQAGVAAVAAAAFYAAGRGRRAAPAAPAADAR